MIKNIIRNTLILVLFFVPGLLIAQSDNRYDSDMNLPFNAKNGDVNPQTGGVSLSYTDLSLPGRAGMDFTYSRFWTLNQSNVFNMYQDQTDGSNELNGDTLDKFNGLGIGWSSNIPYIFNDSSSGEFIQYLFLNGQSYQVDRNGIELGDRINESNIIGYDLLDKRIYKSSLISYEELSNFQDLRSRYSLSNSEYDRSVYVLVMADNSKFFFDENGQLMMQQDKTGLNKIWYFYKNNYVTGGKKNLALVLDSIGREIKFNYNINGYLEEITWDDEINVKSISGTRILETKKRSIQYNYDSLENTPELSALKGYVLNYRQPYKLTSVTNKGGYVTTYAYSQGKAEFSFDYDIINYNNIYLLLNEITTFYTEEEGENNYRNKRIIDYKVPADGMFQKPFYNGYMEFFKVSNSFYLDRHGNKLYDTHYTYYKEGQAGNYLQYSTDVQVGNLKATYIYSLNSDSSKFQTLSSVSKTTLDGYSQITDYIYDNDRKKTHESVWIQGNNVYNESFIYDKKGNIELYTDRNGVETKTTYWDEFSIPKLTTRKFTDEYGTHEYKTENIIYETGSIKGLLKEKKTYLENGSVITDSSYKYDIYGNVIENTNDLGHTNYIVYDSTYNAFPVKEYQNVTISNWGLEGVDTNWLGSHNGLETSTLSIYRVFNSDGSVWLEFDNEGYGVEHFYDDLGTEVETINPDSDDDTQLLTSFSNNLSFNYIRENSTGFQTFLSSRLNNPGARVEVDYVNDLVKSEIDFDLEKGGVKKTGVQKDGLGNIEEEYLYNGNDSIYSVKKMTYDNLGNMIALTDPDASANFSYLNVGDNSVEYHDKTWVVKYDDLNRQIKVLYPQTSSGRTDIKNIIYNDEENSVTTIDPLGRSFYTRKDWSGNTVEVKNFGNSETNGTEVQIYLYEYDQLNRKVKFTDPEGLVTKYKYDERNLLIEQIYFDLPNNITDFGSDNFFYNTLGQVLYKTDRKGQVIHFDYDELSRNTFVKHYNSLTDYENTPESPVRTVKTDYDKRGNAVRIESESLIEHYKYDYANRVEILNRHITDNTVRAGIESVTGIPELNQVLSFSYKYNDGGMVTNMTYPDSSEHAFVYDNSLGFLTGINQGSSSSLSSFINSMEYNKSGVVTRMNYANNTFQTWNFDNRKRISQIEVYNSGSELLEKLNYKLNGVGDVTSINDTYTYDYDGFGRIVGAKTLLPGKKDPLKLVQDHFGSFQNATMPNLFGTTYNVEADIFPVGSPDGVVNGEDHIQATLTDFDTLYDDEKFTYDKNGNRLTLNQNGDVYRYVYGKRNRLDSVYVTKKGEATESLFISYLYDANGNTIERVIKASDGDKVTTFTYDTLNRLIKSEENGIAVTYKYDNAGNRFVKTTPEKTTVYLRHGQISVAMDIDINTNQTTELGTINRYVLSGDLVAGRVKTVKKADLSQLISNSYYHLDHLNSTKLITNDLGEVEVNYTYRAFGEHLKRLDKDGNDTTDKARYSYGGKELDDNSNLYYFNARYYDATIGRFINVDPIQDGTNWYVYCNNNPLNMVDPTGLSEFSLYNFNRAYNMFGEFVKNPIQTAEAISAERLNSINNPSLNNTSQLLRDYNAYKQDYKMIDYNSASNVSPHDDSSTRLMNLKSNWTVNFSEGVNSIEVGATLAETKQKLGDGSLSTDFGSLTAAFGVKNFAPFGGYDATGVAFSYSNPNLSLALKAFSVGNGFDLSNPFSLSKSVSTGSAVSLSWGSIKSFVSGFFNKKKSGKQQGKESKGENSSNESQVGKKNIM